MIKTISFLRSLWITGYKPTQQNFSDMFDSVGSITQKIYTAGEAIGGQRVLMVSGGKAFYFDPSDMDNYDKVIGMSMHASVLNDNINVMQEGVITIGGLTADATYYTTSGGLITTTVPTSGILQKVGVALNTSDLIIEFSQNRIPYGIGNMIKM